MRRAFWTLGLIGTVAAGLTAGSSLAIAPHAIAADTPHIKGLWLTTDYPAIAARAGESTTIKLKLQNYDLAPERVALSLDGVPQGWKAAILGGAVPVAAAMPATNENVPLEVRLDIPADAKAGTDRITLHAKASDASADLPLDIEIGQDLPAQLSIKAKLPSLKGTPTTSFEYQFTVKNDSDKDLLVKLAADAPPGFQTTFTEAYGTQELASAPVEAGKDKDFKIKVTPPATVQAGDYPVTVDASAESAQASTKLDMDITGQPKLSVTGADDGRLSAQAEAGSTTPISLTVSNDGSAPAQDVTMSGSPPTDWKIEFQPQKIAEIAPNQKVSVQALLTPSAKALAGDYMTTIRANGKDSSSSADYRITVATSTLWGAAGVGIIAIALLVGVGAVARFGRR